MDEHQKHNTHMSQCQ